MEPQGRISWKKFISSVRSLVGSRVGERQCGLAKIDVTHFALVLRDFTAERDWDPFYSPKNLAMALSVETAELPEFIKPLTLDAFRFSHL